MIPCGCIDWNQGTLVLFFDAHIIGSGRGRVDFGRGFFRKLRARPNTESGLKTVLNELRALIVLCVEAVLTRSRASFRRQAELFAVFAGDRQP